MNKRFYRSSRDKMIAGVASGIAEYFNIDPVLTRVAFVVLALSIGFGFLAYIILWIIVPYDYQITERRDFSETKDESRSNQTNDNRGNSFERQDESSGRTGRNILAVILIVLGILLLLDNLITEFTFNNIGPILLIIIGALILIFAKKNSGGKS